MPRIFFFPSVIFCLFYLFLFSFFITINSSRKLAFVLKNKTTKLSYHCNLVSFEETGGLSCKSKIYTTNGAGLGLVVLREDNGILDKITICWWHLQKISPCKFLNDSKLLLGNLKVFYRPKREWGISKMPQQSWNKILDLRVTGTWIRKRGWRLGHAYNGLKFK